MLSSPEMRQGGRKFNRDPEEVEVHPPEPHAETEETPVSQEGQRQAAQAAVRLRSAPPQATPVTEASGVLVDTGTPTATMVTTALTRTSS